MDRVSSRVSENKMGELATRAKEITQNARDYQEHEMQRYEIWTQALATRKQCLSNLVTENRENGQEIFEETETELSRICLKKRKS